MGSSGPLTDPGRLPAPAILVHTPVFPRSVSFTAEDRGHGPTLVRQVERGLASSPWSSSCPADTEMWPRVPDPTKSPVNRPPLCGETVRQGSRPATHCALPRGPARLDMIVVQCPLLHQGLAWRPEFLHPTWRLLTDLGRSTPSPSKNQPSAHRRVIGVPSRDQPCSYCGVARVRCYGTQTVQTIPSSSASPSKPCRSPVP